MKKSIIALALGSVILFTILITAKPLLAEKGDSIQNAKIEYKVILNLGKRSTISKMEKALDSFVEQEKEKALLEIDLRKFGDEGWELVYFERETSFAIFHRVYVEKK